MELFIYRFLTLGAKKPKNSLNRSSWGSIGSLVVRAFNAWQVTVTLDREGKSLDREGISLDWEGKTTEKERVFFTPLDRTSTGKGESIDRHPSQLSLFGQTLNRFTIFYPKTYLFLVFLLQTLRQGLQIKLCQFWNVLPKVFLIDLGFVWKCNFKA